MICHHRPQTATQKGFYTGLRGEDPALGMSGSFSPDWWNLEQTHPIPWLEFQHCHCSGRQKQRSSNQPLAWFRVILSCFAPEHNQVSTLKAQVEVKLFMGCRMCFPGRGEVIYRLEDVFPKQTLTRKLWG